MNLIEKNSMDLTVAGKQKIPTQKRATESTDLYYLPDGSALFCASVWRRGSWAIFRSCPQHLTLIPISMCPACHYFTISCILIPGSDPGVPETWHRRRQLWKKVLLLLGNATAVGIPIFCVSRFQLLFSVGFAAVIYVLLYKKITWKMVVGGRIG